MENGKPTSTATKSDRLNVRLTSDANQTIREAASLAGQDITSFVLSAALDRARSVIAEDSLVRLSAIDARDLAAALESDASPVPQLMELLRRAIPSRVEAS